MVVPKRVEERIKAGLRRFHKILDAARRADRNEQDTSMIVSDLLSEVFGYKKYEEITGQYLIRGTYCDLAVKIGSRVAYLVEVKAVDKRLRKAHLRQSTDYAAKEGIEWVVLTNGVEWQVRRMIFEQPLRDEMVFSMDLLGEDTQALVERVYLLSREGILKKQLGVYHEEQKATDRYMVASIVTTDAALSVLRRQLRRMYPGVRIATEEIRSVLLEEVFKRDIVESEEFQQARTRIKRAEKRRLRKAVAAPKPPD